MSPIPTTTLSSTGIKIGQIGLGLLSLTWTAKPTPQEDAFQVMKAAIEAGVTLWNGATFYGPPGDPHAGLKLIKAFFDKYPEHKSQVTLSIKGGVDVEVMKQKGMAGFIPDASIDALRLDLERARETLDVNNGGKEIDLYEMVRRDVRTSVEDTVKNLVKLSRDEKLFRYISLSEVGEETIRKAAATGPIAAVEIEYSPWELTAENNGVLKACQDLGITVLAYSPIGRGLLGGRVQSRADLAAGDIRLHQDRFSDENLPKNLKLFEDYEKAAKQNGITPAQLSLAWLIAQSPTGGIVPIPGTTNVGRIKENAEAANVKLTEEEMRAFRALIDSTQVAGERYSEQARRVQPLWG